MRIINKFPLSVLFLISFFSSLNSQILVSKNEIIYKDTVLTLVQNSTIASKTIYASGQAKFKSNLGYIRILLSNKNGYDLLIYESTPLFSINGTDDFEFETIETSNISKDLGMSCIRVEVKNAILSNLNIGLTNSNIARDQQEINRLKKISLINQNLQSRNAPWKAGETSISRLSYEEKKRLFRGVVPDLQGIEYYKGGVFEIISETENILALEELYKSNQSVCIPSFDWRNRHGKNWLTSVKNQNSCGSCAIFAATGATEALVNLYYNRPINYDLAEQEAVSCLSSSYYNCSNGWFTSTILNYYTNTGVVTEECFPYQENSNIPCSDICTNANDKIKIGGKVDFPNSTYLRTEESLKKMIIKYGPISSGISSWRHAMTLSGYFYDSTDNSVVWIFKNSWGTDWGDNGWGNIKVNINDIAWTHALLPPITSFNYTDADIICEDRDGDGYYFWGIGSKPSHCPDCPDEPDGDDSNPLFGPMDEYGYLRVLINNQTFDSDTTMNFCKDVEIRNTTIKFSADVTVSSGVSINLLPGFNVESGGQFEARIEPCDVTSNISFSPQYANSFYSAGNTDLSNRSMMFEEKIVDFVGDAQLFQNIPNPSRGSTVIPFNIPFNAADAYLNIVDMTGVVIKKISLIERGSGKIEIETSGLHKGLYIYSLIIDGKVAGTKKMQVL